MPDKLHSYLRRSLPGLLALSSISAMAADCERLASARWAHTEITAATDVPAGGFEPPARGRFGGFGQQAYADLPPFCRIEAISRPAAGSEIGIEVWMPASAWNGKIQVIGNGGWAGSIGQSTMATALAAAYAVAATDTGHRGGTADFISEQPDKLVDFADRAVHETIALARTLVDAYYERPAERAYFTGCSTGGRQALMAAQRYPDDFDGIVSGAAAYYPSHIHGTQVWTAAVANRTETARLTTDQFRLLNDAAIAACDTQDGVADGVIENPLQCGFDPGSLACPADGGGSCLNPEQIETARLTYAGPTDRNGDPIYPGLERGSETGWSTLSSASPLSIALETYELLVYPNEDWDWRDFDPESDIPIAVERIDPLLSAADPDLGAFVGGGGKLLLYHGWSDPGIPPGGTVRYAESVRAELGAATSDDSVRLFMVPGMGHCAGGTGTDRFDMIAALDAWFETNEPPARIEAARVVNGETVRTRPLCAWPAVATYNGDGSTDDSGNFDCR